MKKGEIIKHISTIFVIVFIQMVSHVYAGELSPSLLERLQYAHKEEYLSVIVRMVDQADLKVATKGIVGRNKALRSRNVIRKLQSTAEGRQVGLITLLEKGKSLGKVDNYTSFWIFNGLSIKAIPAVIKKIASRYDVDIVRLDLPISPADIVPSTPLETDSHYTWNIERIKAPEVWELGIDGSGVVVGVFDTGVDVTHPDLAGKYRGGENSWFDPFEEHTVPVDVSENGHGTHVAGIIMGGDVSGKYIGVAPGVQWIAASSSEDCLESCVHNVFQWFMDPDGNPDTDDGPDVVSNSWYWPIEGLFGLEHGCELIFHDDIKAWQMAGIIPVFAAGNFGPCFFTGSTPANYPETIAVGNTNFFDIVAWDSSRGPNNCDFRSIFPDICAPGRHIQSSVPNGDYAYFSGTSMAAPHVTGIIALMLDANPDLDIEEISSILKTTAKPLGFSHPNYTYGWGRVDALKAVTAALSLE